ncbi:formate dehydrogenase accessory sulfurtransferase FdhD [Ekhidna sp.]|uniref:formate dehydrogenase accessory sulfurtransferase FdhD n=1 Tax=Ekhidna sp. TaxID=2608089 RepID=UPI003B5B7388
MSSVVPHKIERRTSAHSETRDDLIVVEEPLEIRLGYGAEGDRNQLSLSVTMRTPGNDEELAIGFLYSEQIISSASNFLSVKYCDDVGKQEQKENVMRVELAPDVKLDPALFKRNFYTTSSCGVCGKASIEQVRFQCQSISDQLRIKGTILNQLPRKLREAQVVFKHTGGLHASALFDLSGNLLFYREDVGRHNALDKLLGHLVLTQDGNATEHILLLSGRISFELVQKASRANIPIIAAIGAPSSLAVDLAEELGITLVGFLKEDKFNIYTHSKRLDA